jgi:predicted GIY-YIG superfamily endonuclease
MWPNDGRTTLPSACTSPIFMRDCRHARLVASIMANRPNGTLYLGVTSDLPLRAWQHRMGISEGFTKRYGLKRLVCAEHHEDIRSAIRRE